MTNKDLINWLYAKQDENSKEQDKHEEGSRPWRFLEDIDDLIRAELDALGE